MHISYQIKDLSPPQILLIVFSLLSLNISNIKKYSTNLWLCIKKILG